MAPPPGVRPHATIHGWGVALTIAVLLWAVAVLASWVAWSLAGPLGVVAMRVLVAAFFGAVLS